MAASAAVSAALCHGPDVEKVAVRNGVVQIRKTGERHAWFQAAASRIPNLFVFLSLAKNPSSSGRAR